MQHFKGSVASYGFRGISYGAGRMWSGTPRGTPARRSAGVVKRSRSGLSTPCVGAGKGGRVSPGLKEHMLVR